MNRTLYTCLFYLAMPFILFRLWFRGIKAPAYRQRWTERLGAIDVLDKDQGALWIHAVSVGETLAITPLVKLIQARHPDLSIVMTTMTPTGAERVRDSLGDSVKHYYCPYDLPVFLKKFITRLRPSACIVVETELWPNMVHICNEQSVPVLVANARLSERSAKGYARFGAMSEAMLQKLSMVAVQNDQDGQRFLNLGLPQKRMSVTGSIKFDIAEPEGALRLASALKVLWGTNRPVIIGASTHDKEEEALINVYKALLPKHPDLLLILVPRHPERFDQVAKLLADADLKYARRSMGHQPDESTQVYLGDTMGELMKLIATSDIAFVGGSLIQRGGHNPLEPAVLGKPVLIGPHFFNFQMICDELEAKGGLVVTPDKESLQKVCDDLLSDQQERSTMGDSGKAFVAENQGALERLYALVDKVCLAKRH